MVCQGHVHATLIWSTDNLSQMFSARQHPVSEGRICPQDADTCRTCWSLLFCAPIFHLKTRNRNGGSNPWHVDRFGSMKKSWMSIIILKYAIFLLHLNSSYKTVLHQFCNVSNFFNVVLLSCALVGRIAPFIQDILQHSTGHFEIIAG